jgi:hypothetical protein
LNRHRTVSEPSTPTSECECESESEPEAVQETLDLGTDEAEQAFVSASEQGDEARAKTSSLEERFNRFWEVWPKKRSRGQAWKTWKSIAPDCSLTDRIIAAVGTAKETWDWRKKGGQFIPYPATWLRGEGWEDEYETDVRPIAGGGNGDGTHQRLAEKDYTIGATRDEDLPDWARDWRGAANA